jgi:aminoglycoside 6'-N-acetyltransferase I
MDFKIIKIATANSSIAPLHLYLSQGFLLKEIIPDFFIENYEKPIFENGVQCRDLMVLEKNI